MQSLFACRDSLLGQPLILGAYYSLASYDFLASEEYFHFHLNTVVDVTLHS